MSLGRYIDQIELNNILNAYIKSYAAMHPGIIQNRRTISHFRVLNSSDNQAAVCFSLETALLGTETEVDLKQNGIIGKNIAERILDSVAYFLVQGIPPAQVPDELRICLGVNHYSSHWTGLMVSLNSLQSFYQNIVEYCQNNAINFTGKFYSDDHESIELNHARNAICESLNIFVDPEDKSLKTPELEKALKILENFKMHIYSYDSMNADRYYDHIKHSLAFVIDKGLLEDKNNLEKIQCRQQEVNTCGDHTIFNLFISSIIQPNLFNPISSQELRDLTDQVKANPDIDQPLATEFINIVEAITQTPMQDSEMRTMHSKNHTCKEFEIEIESMLHKLFNINEENAFKMIYAVLSDKSLNSIANALGDIDNDDKLKEQWNLGLQLEAIMNGKPLNKENNNIFKKIALDDLYAYGVLAKIIAQDICVEVESSKTKLNPRRHPLFPTVAEAAKKTKLVCSDHLPILAEVPLQNGTLKIISLNVLGPGVSASGFHSNWEWETKEESIARYARLVDGLVNGIKKQGVDVIALQEASQECILPVLKEKLSQANLQQEWDFIVDDRTGIITCYNKSKFELKTTSLNHYERIRSLILHNKENEEEVEVHNVWGQYNPFPRHAEQLYTKLIDGRPITSVIIGDTNSRIAPLHNNAMNITTGVIPIGLNELNGVEKNFQVPDYPDGGFRYDIKDNAIHQLEIHKLDYDSGEIIVDERTEEELKSWPEFRMVLCLDKYYQEAKLIDNMTIYEFEDQLKETLPEDFMVRVAADSYNRKAVAIRFNAGSELYQYLINKLDKIPEVQIRHVADTNDGNSYPTIFVPFKHIPLLEKAVVDYKTAVTQYAKSSIKLVNRLVDRIDQNDKALSKMSRMSKKAEDIRTRVELIKSNKYINDLKTFAESNRTLDHVKNPYEYKLKFIKWLIENHQYDLGFFGGIEDNGKKYSHSACHVKKWVEKALEKPLSEQGYNRIFEEIEMVLGLKCHTKPGFLGFGRRSKSTVDLYNQILDTIGTKMISTPCVTNKNKMPKNNGVSNISKLNLFSKYRVIEALGQENDKASSVKKCNKH